MGGRRVRYERRKNVVTRVFSLPDKGCFTIVVSRQRAATESLRHQPGYQNFAVYHWTDWDLIEEPVRASRRYTNASLQLHLNLVHGENFQQKRRRL